MEEKEESSKEIVSSYTMLKFYINLSLQEIKNRKLNYILGVIACLLVVVVVTVSLSTLVVTPIISLRQSEERDGEIDLHVRSGWWTKLNSVNYTKIEEKILENPGVMDWSSPRIEYEPHIYPWSNCIDDSIGVPLPGNKKHLLGKYDNLWTYDGWDNSGFGGSVHSCKATDYECLEDVCGTGFKGKLFVINSEKEEFMGLGRNWNYTRAPYGSVYIRSSFANAMGLEVGHYMYMSFKLTDRSLRALWDDSLAAEGLDWWTSVPMEIDGVPVSPPRNTYPYYWSWINIPIRIEAIFDSPNGKFESSESDALIIEYDDLAELIYEYAAPFMNSGMKDTFRATNMYEYAYRILFNIPPDRLDVYTSSNYEVVQKTVTWWASAVLYNIGFPDLQTELTVLKELENRRFDSMFLGLIINIIIIILTFLSSMLIYSLLMISVESRTFEMGVLRMVGTTRDKVLKLLLVQALMFSIPSIVGGLILSFIGQYYISEMFYNITFLRISRVPEPSAIVAAIVLGLAVPMVSSILPIRSALGKNLHDSLDTRRNKVKIIDYKIERSDGTDTDWKLVILGLVGTVAGFLIYYLFPLALLSLNLGLMLRIFLGVLLGMLFGLVILGLNLQAILERLLVKIFLSYWEKASIVKILLKNLVTHRTRNRKTSTMYSLSLGFIIFLAVFYNMQVSSIIINEQQSHGQVMILETNQDINEKTGHSYDIQDRIAIETYLDSLPFVIDHAWTSQSIADACPHIERTNLKNIGRTHGNDVNIYAVSPNFFDVALPGYFTPGYRMPSTDIFESLGDHLYSPHGSRTALIPSLFYKNLKLQDPGQHFMFDIDGVSQEDITSAQDAGNPLFTEPQPHNVTRIRPLAFLDMVPIYTLTKFPASVNRDTLVSFTTWLRMTDNYFRSIDEIPMHIMLIKLTEDVTDDQLDSLAASLEDLGGSQAGVEVWDYRLVSEGANSAVLLMNVLFGITAIIGVMISFFSLSSSMATNILEQAKEIGILRAIGLKKVETIRLYVYEAFFLTVAASMNGILTGSVVGYSLSSQQALFMSIPLRFEFPWIVVIILIPALIILAIVAARGPAAAMLKKPITIMIRDAS